MNPRKPGNRKKATTYFSVTSLGKDRWYWVVWPTLTHGQTDNGKPHLAEGFAATKAEAADQALEVAGLYGEWVAAKYAKQYYQQQQKSTAAAPAIIEFLYRDIRDEETQEWISIPHRIVNKTKKYIYVEQKPYIAGQRSGSWLDFDGKRFRLDRAMLEEEGYTLAPITEIDDPLFFATPYQERVTRYRRSPPACLALLGLTFPASEADIKAAYRRLVKTAHPDQGGSHEAFLALQEAYEQALRLCR